MSLAKYLKPLTDLAPRPVVTWDKHERIARNKEIWADKDSVVHRLPKHYQKRYWKNLLADRSPVHYRPPEHRFYWDKDRVKDVETENYPILPEYTPEQDQSLWAGEGVVKGYIESRPYLKKKVLPRHWVPHLWFPNMKDVVLYSEVLDKYMKISVTERAMRLIESLYGLDYYLLETSELDLNSKLGCDLKRSILIKLAKQDYYMDDNERHEYVKKKYAKYIIPMEEAEWVGLDLNSACRKQQDIEDSTKPIPFKHVFERDLVKQLSM